jgi:DNA gyrase inhibitor GyrI
MNALNVRIVELEPVRVASFHAYGQEPEIAAWGQLVAWARPKGLLDDPEGHQVYGFNNPSPSPGSPNYGYEFWITVGPEVEAEEPVEIKQFPGGLYAVARCQVGGKPYETIPSGWKQLVLWREDSAYKPGGHQWLEEHIRLDRYPQGEWDLNLYLPIEGSDQEEVISDQ